MPNNDIVVTSHVARDFLQNAAYFSTLSKVVWEYVSNSLDNAKEDTPVTVSVTLFSGPPKTMIIADDGIGMSRSDLIRFFQMHGENIQRKKGKRVRGRFGTGKSAAYGIANVLMIETIKDGLQNKVRLSRDNIESASDGKAFPVEVLEEDVRVSDDNSLDGTRIFISDFIDEKLKFEPVIIFIERHLSRYKQKATVIINDHTCKFNEPPCSKSYEFQPDNDDRINKLGNVTLTIKVSPKPLDAEFVGVDVLSYGIWHETTLAGSENKDLANRIFGEIDVENLEDDKFKIPPFDNTRNNQLNRANPLVVMLLAWMGEKIEIVRQELVKEEEKRRKSEQFKRLQKSSKDIEKILNDDFNTIIDHYELARKVSSTQARKMAIESAVQGVTLPGDGDLPSSFDPAGFERGDGHTSGENPPGEGEFPREMGPNLIPGDHPGSPQEISNKESQRKVKRGVF